MITINVKPIELFDESKQEFFMLPGGSFRFENSLRAISKWEEKWNKPFFKKENISNDEALDYYKCMCLDEGFKDVYLTGDVINQLSDYVNKNHTATTFHSQKNNSSHKQTLTSELLYAYMVLANIPFECDEWEISRLMVLINCVSILQTPKKKKNSRSTAKDYSKLNAARRASMNSKG